MIENKTFCFLNKTLFVRLNSDGISYLNPNLSLAYFKTLDERIKQNGGFDYYFFKHLEFLNGDLIVIPVPSKLDDYFLFNYVEKNNGLIMIQTLNYFDYLSLFNHQEQFLNKLESVMEEFR